MARPSGSFNKSRLIVLTLMLACLIFLATGVWTSIHMQASHAYQQEIMPRVTNKTNALRFISEKKVGEGVRSDVEVTLLNQSSHNITAYMISMGEFSVTTCCNTFAPGETRIENIPFGNLEAHAAKNPDHAGELVLSAVYLEGGARGGEAKNLNRLKSRISGIKEQVK